MGAGEVARPYGLGEMAATTSFEPPHIGHGEHDVVCFIGRVRVEVFSVVATLGGESVGRSGPGLLGHGER